MNGTLRLMSHSRQYGDPNFNILPQMPGVKLATVQTADARFLRRIFIAMVVLTVFTGVAAGLATVNAMSAQGMDLCQATGLLCAN